MARLWTAVGGVAAWVMLSLQAAGDDPPRPTSHFGSMPNGWAGYSLLQHPRSRPPLADGDHHGHGHHGHGHHGHGHAGWRHGFGRYGYAGHRYPGHGYRIGGACPICLSAVCFNPYCGFYATSGITFSFGVPMVAAAPAPWVNRWHAGQLGAAGAGAVVAAANADVAKEEIAAEPPQPLAAAERAAADEGAEEIRRRVSALRASNSTGRQRADRLIAVADRYFSDQDYRRAASKYRQALTSAADYPAVHFRLGHAYVATGDFQLALTHFLMALELSGSIDRPGFSLEDLYRGDEVAKQTHLNRLFDAALRDPEDGGLLMLVGLSLHYDGQPLRARGFFERAVEIAGAHQTPAQDFLPVAESDAR